MKDKPPPPTSCPARPECIVKTEPSEDCSISGIPLATTSSPRPNSWLETVLNSDPKASQSKRVPEASAPRSSAEGKTRRPSPARAPQNHNLPPPSRTIPIERKCRKCKFTLPTSHFSRYNGRLKTACNDCVSQENGQRAFRMRKSSSIADAPDSRGYRVQKAYSLATTVSSQASSKQSSVATYSPINSSVIAGINGRCDAMGVGQGSRMINYHVARGMDIACSISESSKSQDDSSVLQAAFKFANTDQDILQYIAPLHPQTQRQQLEDAIERIALATRLLAVKDHFRSDKRINRKNRDDYFKEIDLLISLTGRGDLVPWPPLADWFDTYTLKIEGIWTGLRVIGNAFAVHRTMRELADELAVAAGIEFTKAKTEIDAVCIALSLEGFEVELNRRIIDVKRSVINDCNTRGCLRLSEVIDQNMVVKARFSELWKADRGSIFKLAE